jgi:hypothetical protein
MSPRRWEGDRGRVTYFWHPELKLEICHPLKIMSRLWNSRIKVFFWKVINLYSSPNTTSTAECTWSLMALDFA